MNKANISVIVPIYKGKHYINMQIEQLEEAAKILGNSIEMIIVNDYPEEPIEDRVSDVINIVIVQTDVNRGIQGARVTGLNAAQGDYILFLDQDDKISPYYFKSQLAAIGEADACVCDCIVNGKNRYGEWKASLSESITEKYNVEIDCGFTVGQTLIKRSGIPDFWKKHWLKHNYCDDYFLWLCMFAEKRNIVANPDILYEHIRTNSNQSDDLKEWFESSLEMIEVLSLGGVFSEDKIRKLRNNVDKETSFELSDIKILKEKNRAYKKLLLVSEKPYLIDEVIDKFDLKNATIAIYGAELGTHLQNVFAKKQLLTECIIDRNANRLNAVIPVVTMDNIPSNVNVVINTIFRDKLLVQQNITQHSPYIRYIHLNEILEEVYE